MHIMRIMWCIWENIVFDLKTDHKNWSFDNRCAFGNELEKIAQFCWASSHIFQILLIFIDILAR